MIYEWIDYSHEHNALVDSWLDAEAQRFTGCDEGFDRFYNYWFDEPETKIGENFWTKIILEDNVPVGIIVISLWDDIFTISEFIICPQKRGKGIGTKALKELLSNAKIILGTDINNSIAVIFPNNIASQKAFEKAGFYSRSEHPDGDAWYYEYKSS